MHLQSFSLSLLFLLPFTISNYTAIDWSMDGLADVLLCIDIHCNGLPDDFAGLNGISKYLKSSELHKYMHIRKTTDENEYYKGNRLALVKIDHKGFDVLMHFNDPSPISKLSIIAEEHFNDRQNQTAPRKMLLKDIFDGIKQTVFAPENGDRVAPNVMIYFYIYDFRRNDAAFHEDLLRYTVDISLRFNEYKDSRLSRWANWREYGKKNGKDFTYLPTDGSDNDVLHNEVLHILVEKLLGQCKNHSMYKYTKCFTTQSTHGTRCVRRKVFKGDAIFPHLCWHGESPIMEPCDKVEECVDKCEEYLDDFSACTGPCNSTGKQIKAYRSNPINCTVNVVDCFRRCIPTTIITAGVSSTFDIGVSGGVQPAGARVSPPGPRTELPQWAMGSIIACCVISGLVILGVLGASVYIALRRAKARRESKGQLKPLEQDKAKVPGTCSVRRGG